jgi:hypothetical protein
MSIRYTKIIHSNALQNRYTKIGIFGSQIYVPSGNPLGRNAFLDIYMCSLFFYFCKYTIDS